MKRKKELWQKRCKCGRSLSSTNKSGYCRDCYIKVWKKKNYGNKKPKGYSIYVAVSE